MGKCQFCGLGGNPNSVLMMKTAEFVCVCKWFYVCDFVCVCVSGSVCLLISVFV